MSQNIIAKIADSIPVEEGIIDDPNHALVYELMLAHKNALPAHKKAIADAIEFIKRSTRSSQNGLDLPISPKKET